LTLANNTISPETFISAPVADVSVTFDFFHLSLFSLATSLFIIVTVAPESGHESTSFPELLISFAFIESVIGIGGVGENFLFPGSGVHTS
jgi:hypothetical protein